MLVRSKNFTINVNTSATNFTTTTGGVTTASSTPVGVLTMKIVSTNTTGTVGGGFNNFTSLSPAPQNLISNANRGNNQVFSVKYKANPGFDYPAAVYSTDVIFTATQQ